MSYGVITILVQKNYITLQLRYNMLPFFDSYCSKLIINDLVYVIAWVAVVFGINCASSAGRKLVIVRDAPACITRAINFKYYREPCYYKLIQYVLPEPCWLIFHSIYIIYVSYIGRVFYVNCTTC